MINTKSTSSTKSGLRLLLAALLFGLVSACSPTETTRTTTTEQTTTHEIVPPPPTSTSVTTTKTQVYTP